MKAKFRDIVDRAVWSDRFFNFDDCADAYAEGKDTEAILTRAADVFLQFHPTCPADAEWLIADFKQRV